MKKVFRKTQDPIKRFFVRLRFYIKKISQIIKFILVVTVISVCIVFFNLEGNELRTKLLYNTYDLYGDLSKFVNNIINRLDEISFCRAENIYDSTLQRENKYLKLQNSILHEELKLVKSKLKLVDNRAYLWITANVTQITYPKDEMALVVSAGEKDGVSVGNIVLDENGVVGRISAVSSNYSVVSLIGNENVKISAIVYPSEQDCIVGNRLDPYHLKLDYISDFDNINDGDKVISSGKDGLTPYGIHIGVIRKINGKPFVVLDNNQRKNTIINIITNNSESPVATRLP